MEAAARRICSRGTMQLDPVALTGGMPRLRVESGIVRRGQFRLGQARMLDARFPPVELIEAVSKPAAVHALARSVERARSGVARLARVHHSLWLRMWERAGFDGLPGAGWVRDQGALSGLVDRAPACILLSGAKNVSPSIQGALEIADREKGTGA